MEFLKLLLSCCVLWRGGAAAAGGDGFPAAAARLLRDIRMPAARAALVPTVLGDLRTILQPRFPGSEAVLFGSIAMGLAIVESDVDACVTFREPPRLSAPELVAQVNNIMLQHPDLFKVIKTVPQARTPILSARHLPTNFSVDISFNYNGVMNSRLVHYLMSLDERARDLAQILKHWSRVHHITGSKMLPSYGIVTMAIFYLQQKQILPTIASIQQNAERFMLNDWNLAFSEHNYEISNDESLCAILGGFFEYYNTFQYETYMVSPFVGRVLEIDLFRALDTVPIEFELYKTNVRLNVTKPLQLVTPLVQDMFEHNTNLAHRMADVARRSMFDTSIEYAARKFREGCTGFLESILDTYYINNTVIR